MTPPLGRGQAVTLLVVSVLAFGLATFFGIKSQSYARCQAGVNDATIAAINARDEPAAADRAAVDRMVADVLAAREPGDTRAALERYQATRAAADAERAANPLPTPPSQAC